MKKLALGCGFLLFLTGIAVAGAAYYLYRQVAPKVAQIAELARIPDLEREVRNRTPYLPPASAELTDAQIDKLVKVQSEVRRRVGERMTAFQAKYQELAQQKDASLADAPQLLQAYGDLAGAWLEAKRAQVDALNAQGLSLEEYRWIRDEAYRALGQVFVDLDLARLADDARRGMSSSDALGQVREAIGSPEVNRKRIEKVRKLLEENLALVSFGL